MSIVFVSPNYLKERRVLDLYADGEYEAIVIFKAVDSNNTPLEDGTIASIDDGNNGRNLANVNSTTAGTAKFVYLSNGIGKFKILPSLTQKSFTITISIEGQSDLTATINFNDPTVDVYITSGNNEDNPQWIDGIEISYAKLILASDYIDANDIEFDVSNRSVVVTYIDESSVNQTIDTTTNSSGIVQVDFGPLTSSYTYNVSFKVQFSFQAGQRTISVDQTKSINVVFTRTPIVSMQLFPNGSYDSPFSLWADGRSADESRDTFIATLSYDYNDNYFTSAQFTIDNPVGVDVDYRVYDDDGDLAIVTPVSDTFTAADNPLYLVVGPSTKTTNTILEAAITNNFTITFGNKTMTYSDGATQNFAINFIEPTFTLEIETILGDDINNPLSLSDNLFPEGSKKTGEGKIDYGDVRAFADNYYTFSVKSIISSNYNHISPDSTNLINKEIEYNSYIFIIDAFSSKVSNFDPNNDNNSFMIFSSSDELIDSSGDSVYTVTEMTEYDVSEQEVFATATINKKENIGDKNIYIKISAETAFDYTFGTRTLDITNISDSVILSDFPPAPRLDLKIQYHSEDPDDEENKLKPDNSQHLFSFVRENAVDSEGNPIQPTEQPEPRRRPGTFTVTATDYLGNQLPSDTEIILRTNDSFKPLKFSNLTTLTDRVARFMFDNPLEIKDEIYIITEVTHNQLYRSVKKKIPYFNSEDKEFYTKNIFKRKIESLTQGFTNDTDIIYDAYGKFNSSFGQTPLYSAVFESAISALDELRNEEFDAKFIVLLTDGVDNFSDVTQVESIEKVHSIDGYQKTHIYPILIKNIYGSAKSSLFDFAIETDSYTEELMNLEITKNINEIIDNILNYEYKDISSTTRTFIKDFKEVIKMEQFDVSITIPNGYKLYIQTRANEESNSINSSDWSNWTTQQQLISGDNTVSFSEALFGRYFEFRLIATPSDI